MEFLNELKSKRIILERNAFLNDVQNDIVFVESGSLKVAINNDGEEQIIRFGYKNDYIVFLDSFISQKPTIFEIQAIKRTSLSVILKKDFEEKIKHSSSALLIWNHILEQLVLQQIEREVDLLTKSPMERYKRVLRRSPQLFQEIPHKHIANYLRMTPETLSRLKKLDFNQE